MKCVVDEIKLNQINLIFNELAFKGAKKLNNKGVNYDRNDVNVYTNPSCL